MAYVPSTREAATLQNDESFNRTPSKRTCSGVDRLGVCHSIHPSLARPQC
jgi:hypothetical protein